MRLINARTLKLEEFFDNIPPYAILSHTWADEEVTFQDMSSSNPIVKAGYRKITKTCDLALGQKIDYAWIDTCCIDKTSSAELTESINSMYEFYTLAQVCFVHLADLPGDVEFKEGIGNCRWNLRGWTLQELIAPGNVEFNDEHWAFRGTKLSFCQELSACTGVPENLLNGKRPITRYSAADRMSWASKRSTTRVEDMAYCLLGVFQVNMPLIYGERHMAFRRLQEEIIKRTNDMTIFAWNPITVNDSRPFCSMFAPSPAHFHSSKLMHPWSKRSHDPEYTLTNKGLRMQDIMYHVPVDDSKTDDRGRETNYVLALGSDLSDDGLDVGLHLRKVGSDLFVRRNWKLQRLGPALQKRCKRTPESSFYVMVDIPGTKVDVLRQFRESAIRFGGQGFHFFPHGLWDSLDQCFLNTPLSLVRGFLIRVGLKTREDQHGVLPLEIEQLGVLIEWTEGHYRLHLFNTAVFAQQARALFARGLNQDTKQRLRWGEFKSQFPEMENLTNQVKFTNNGSVFVITASSTRSLERVQGFSDALNMFRFGLHIRQETEKGELIREMDGMEVLY